MAELTKTDTPGPHDDLAETAAAPGAPAEGGFSSYLTSYAQRVRGGDMGSLPAVIGLIVLSAIFWVAHHPFGTLSNFAAVLQQSAPSVFIALGLVFVLLIAEIDLSAGTAAGVCACLMARLSAGYGWAWPWAILAALVCGVVIGVFTGWICAKVRIPSFVVTLALFLAYQGVVLYIVDNGKGLKGNISVSDNFIVALDNGQMAKWAGWLMVAILVIGFALIKAYDAGRRARAGLNAEPITVIGLKALGLAVVAAVAVYLLNSNRASHAGTASFVNQGGKIVKVTVKPLEG
ncbi:MAG: ABC transporter permease subunit, partial [Trebonia sp.]